MSRSLLAAVAASFPLTLGALPALAEGPLNVTTYGGAFAKTVEEAYVKPFSEAISASAVPRISLVFMMSLSPPRKWAPAPVRPASAARIPPAPRGAEDHCNPFVSQPARR